MSIESGNRTASGRISVDADELMKLDHDGSLHHESPSNMNLVVAHTLPIVNHIREWQPHAVIACDRGARLFGTAINSMWHEVHQEPLPTYNGMVDFARISSSGAYFADPIVARREMGKNVRSILRGARKINKLDRDEPLKAFFIDDLILKGRVRELISRMVSRTNTDIHMGVTRKGNDDVLEAEVYGNTGELPRLFLAAWDHPLQIGVEYDDNNRLIGCPSEVSQDNYRRLQLAVERVADIVRIEE